MRLKRYHTDELSNKVAEANESLAQENELISLLVSSTTSTERRVKETIHFIKKTHGNIIWYVSQVSLIVPTLWG